MADTPRIRNLYNPVIIDMDDVESSLTVQALEALIEELYELEGESEDDPRYLAHLQSQGAVLSEVVSRIVQERRNAGLSRV